MSEWERDVAAWAQAHDVSVDVEPLFEIVQQSRFPVGFTVNLYARLPTGGPVAERWVETAELRSDLRRMLKSLDPAAGYLEVQPLRTTPFRAPGVSSDLEIVVHAHLFSGEDRFTVLQRFRAMGFRERRRRPEENTREDVVRV
jgi:hypothetical protein